MSILFVMAAKLFSSVCTLVNELMRSNKIHENLMKNQAFNFFSVGEDYQRNVVENKNMVKGVITF